MWRWLGPAVLLASICVVVACGYGAHDAGPCIGDDGEPEWGLFGPTVNAGSEFHRELYRTYAARLDAELGETAKLTLTIRNKTAEAQTLTTMYTTPVEFIVAVQDDCRQFWSSIGGISHRAALLRFGPGEEKTFTGEWNFLLNGEEKVPWGKYIAYALVGLHDGIDGERVGLYEYTGRAGQLTGVMAAFRYIRVEERHLRAARVVHPPTPVDPHACGEPLRASRREELMWLANTRPPDDLIHASRVLEKRGDALRALRDGDDRIIQVHAGTLLDENRRITQEFGIRVVVSEPLPEDWELPECLEDVPVQVVVDLDGH